MLPSFTIPTRTERHTYMAVFYGVVILIWLTSEATDIRVVAFLGLGLSIGILGLMTIHRFGGCEIQPKWWLSGAFAGGGLVGLTATFMTFMLMLFKNVQHSHLTPDFSGDMMVDVLKLAPFWGIAGMLIGGAIALGRIALHSPDIHETV